MARTSRSVAKKARHNKWLKRAKGFQGRRSQTFKLAKEAVLKAGQYALRDRRKKKSVRRATWQIAINTAVRPLGLSYSRFIHALREHQVGVDRKILAQLAKEQPAVFKQIVEKVSAK
jgi:large subunit ribosomal protein L20